MPSIQLTAQRMGANNVRHWLRWGQFQIQFGSDATPLAHCHLHNRCVFRMINLALSASTHVLLAVHIILVQEK